MNVFAYNSLSIEVDSRKNIAPRILTKIIETTEKNHY